MQLNGSRWTARELKAAQAAGAFDPAGDCMSPVEVSLRGLPDPVRVGLGLEPDRNAIVTFDTRCRVCEACLNYRRRLWTARAISETGLSVRTWFGTLTIRPEDRVRLLYKADLRATRERCEPWSCLTEAEQYRAIVREVSPDVTNFLKRVRKNSGARVRYLLVSEAHSDGFPHWHLLIHEHVGAVTKSTLEAAWKLGFSHWRLVDRNQPAQTGYVCKYLSKSALTRVRASQSYGQVGELTDLLAERIQGALACASARRKSKPSSQGEGEEP